MDCSLVADDQGPTNTDLSTIRLPDCMRFLTAFLEDVEKDNIVQCQIYLLFPAKLKPERDNRKKHLQIRKLEEKDPKRSPLADE